jgi:hypothetical protein
VTCEESGEKVLNRPRGSESGSTISIKLFFDRASHASLPVQSRRMENVGGSPSVVAISHAALQNRWTENEVPDIPYAPG